MAEVNIAWRFWMFFSSFIMPWQPILWYTVAEYAPGNPFRLVMYSPLSSTIIVLCMSLYAYWAACFAMLLTSSSRISG